MSVIIEATKHNAIQKFISALEPLLRRVVKEEVELALSKHLPCKKRHCGKQIHPSTSRSLQLQFINKLSLPIFTGSKIEGEDCSGISIALVDALTGEAVTSGPESSMKVEVVVLEGDFEGDQDDNWTFQDFDDNIVREREGKRPLLTGDVLLNLNEGIGVVGELMFTDNSSWTRSRKFRLGARAVDGYVDGIRVIEAKTDAFMVKDHRGELYKKHYPPSLVDEVWRLEKIGKDGAFHKRLNSENINTVKDFLTLLCIDTQRLRNILGTGMSAKMWEITVDHAWTCTLDRRLFVYYTSAQQRTGVIFNIVGQMIGLHSELQFVPVKDLSDTQKANAHKLVKAAFDRWDEVIPYDDGSITGSSSHAPAPTLFPPDSPPVECPYGSFSSYHRHKPGGFSFTPPSVSSPDMVTSILSIGGVRSLDDYALQAIDNLELRNEPEPQSFHAHDFYRDSRMAFCRTPNSAIADVESISQTFCGEDHFHYFDADSATTLQLPQILSSAGSRTDIESTVVPTAGSHSEAYTASHGKAYTTWTMLIGVLKWKFSIRRIVARRKRSKIWEKEKLG
ncbi:calmodulin-binding protein 60 A-like isoform X2 [Magnolia sinica]|uniref:calmodulin-binding protein 60 A-like isoform X2 n=1 Tax=Magnolia sinica TaxID=86752 RepID=UPI002659DA0C|nr:calmodulin-binding protein 60 A-like isoform X2 [Magnolia sinica]